jgi:octaprenyl-diphosphate synthase
MGKNPGKDLEEGKLTLPMIAALKRATVDEKTKVKAMISAGVVTNEDLEWVREFLNRRNGISETLLKSREYLSNAVECLAMFPDSYEKRALIRLSDKILHRTY